MTARSRFKKGELSKWKGPAGALVLGGLICQMGVGFGYVLGSLAGDIIGELGWTRTMYSSARAPQLFVIALTSPLIGAATIRFGPRRVLSISAVLLGSAFLLLSELESIWQLYALVVVMGFAVAGLGDITVGQAVSQWFTRRRGLALGIVYTGSNLGGAFLTRASGFVAEAESWRTAFFLMGLGAFVVLLPAALWLVRDPVKPAEASQPDAATDPSDEKAMNLQQALRTRSFWILAFTLFSFFFYFIGMLEHLVLFLTDTGLPTADARAWFSNAILLGLASKILLGWAADRLPQKTSILLDYGLLAASSLVLLALPDATLLPVFILTYGFATAARDVVYPLIINHCFGVRYMAQIYGALMLGLLPGGALGPIFAATIHDQFGSYAHAFQTFACLNLVAVLTLCFLRNEREPSAAGGQPLAT